MASKTYERRSLGEALGRPQEGTYVIRRVAKEVGRPEYCAASLPAPEIIRNSRS